MRFQTDSIRLKNIFFSKHAKWRDHISEPFIFCSVSKKSKIQIESEKAIE